MGKSYLALIGAALVAVLVLAVVAGAEPPVNTTPPSIDDTTPSVGQTLTGNDGVWTVSPDETTRAREWLVDGAQVGTGTTYGVTAADVGKAIVYRVTVSNLDGSVPASSSPTAAVTGTPPTPPAGGIPPITGAFTVGGTLEAHTGAWGGVPAPGPGDFSYQWIRCNPACSDIPGANGWQLGALQPSDVGATFRVRISATTISGTGGPVESPATPAIGGPTTPPPGPLPAPTGTAAVGQTLTAVEGSAWGGSPPPSSFTYQWKRCDAAGANCGPIDGATANTYVVQQSDAPAAGARLVVAITATNGVGSPAGPVDSAATAIVTGPPFNDGNPPTTLPAVAGDPIVGQTLTASPGTWLGYPAPGAFEYRWQRCDVSGTPETCADIPEATQASYTLQQVDAPTAGGTIRVVVKATNGSAPQGVEAASAPAGPVTGKPVNTGEEPMALPTISDGGDETFVLGDVLTADPGVWLGYPGPDAGMTFQYQWLRCDGPPPASSDSGAGCVTIDGATDQVYVPTQLDVGATIRVAVVASNSAGTSPTEEPARVKSSKALAQVVFGPPQNDGSLGTVGPGPLTDQGTPAGTPDGVPQRGETLTADSGLWRGWPMPQITHQWERCPDATATACEPVGEPVAVNTSNVGIASVPSTSKLPLADAELGSFLRVVVTAANAYGSVSLAVPALGPVNGAPELVRKPGESDPVQAPTVSGFTQVGGYLAALPGQWSAFPADSVVFTYQWLRCETTALDSCAVVQSGERSLYQVTAGDAGKRMRVRVLVANGIAPDGVAVSAPTDVVAATPTGAGGVDLLLQVGTVTSGANVTVRLTISNVGTATANGVTVDAQLPEGLTFVGAKTPAGSCSAGVTCSLGAIGSRQSTVVELGLRAARTATYELTASVSSAGPELSPRNNTVTTSVFVNLASAGPRPGGGGSVGTSGSDDGSVVAQVVNLRAKRTAKAATVKTQLSVGEKARLVITVVRDGVKKPKPILLLKGSRITAKKLVTVPVRKTTQTTQTTQTTPQAKKAAAKKAAAKKAAAKKAAAKKAAAKKAAAKKKPVGVVLKKNALKLAYKTPAAGAYTLELRFKPKAILKGKTYLIRLTASAPGKKATTVSLPFRG